MGVNLGMDFLINLGMGSRGDSSIFSGKWKPRPFVGVNFDMDFLTNLGMGMSGDSINLSGK